MEEYVTDMYVHRCTKACTKHASIYIRQSILYIYAKTVVGHSALGNKSSHKVVKSFKLSMNVYMHNVRHDKYCLSYSFSTTNNTFYKIQ